MPVNAVRVAVVFGGNGDLCLCVPADQLSPSGRSPTSLRLENGAASVACGRDRARLVGLSDTARARIAGMTSVLLAEVDRGTVSRLSIVPISPPPER